jgi:hypothetical protein
MRYNFYIDTGFSAIAGLCKNKVPIVIDLKAVFNRGDVNKMNVLYWTL